MAKETLFQEIISEGLDQFERTKISPPPQTIEEENTDAYGFSKEDMDAYNRVYSTQSPSINTTVSKKDINIDNVIGVDTTLLDPEEQLYLNKVSPSLASIRTQATEEVKNKYGPDFVSLPPDQRLKMIEYETDNIIAAQFGDDPERSTLGTVVANYLEDYEKSPMSNLEIMRDAFFGWGGTEASIDPTTGKEVPYDYKGEQWIPYNKLIPGFDDMSFSDRREAIIKAKNKRAYERHVAMGSSQEGALAAVSGFAGLLTDPTTLLPMGQTYKGAAILGGLIAGSDMALYDFVQNGEIKPSRVATATALGAFGGPAFMYLGKQISRGAQWQAKKSIINKYETEYSRSLAKGVPKDIADIKARAYAGNLTQGGLEEVYKATGRVKQIPETPAIAKANMEERLSFFHRYDAVVNAGKRFENFITPIIDRIGRKIPKIAHSMRKMELEEHLRQDKWFKEAEPFFIKMRSWKNKDVDRLNYLITSEAVDRWQEAYTLLRKYEQSDKKYKGIINDFDKVREVIKEVGVMYKQHGYKLDLLAHYFPRVATNPSALRKVPNGFLLNAIKDARLKKGSKLTDSEIERLINDIINFKIKPGKKAKVSGSVLRREIETLHDVMIKHYARPEAAFHSYIRLASKDIARARFLKGHAKGGVWNSDGTGIHSAVSKMIRQEGKKLELDGDEMDEIIDLLQSRLTTGEMSPHGFWKVFKNIGYATTLGNPLSAMTQLGDQAFSMQIAGIRNAIKAAGLPKQVDKQITLGLSDALEEIYSNPAKTKKFLDTTLKYGGFNIMDNFGKNTIINGALRKYINQIKTDKGRRQFISKWGEYFEGETGSLISDLEKFGKTFSKKMKTGKQAGKDVSLYGGTTDNIRLLLWHTLSDVQPISLSEMPKFYLDHPNMRVAYMLKTFTVKQLDFMRREIFRKFNEGKIGEGTKNLTTFVVFWTLMNGAADKLKSVMTGDEFDVTDNMVDNMLQLMVWSRYSNEKAHREGIYQSIAEYLLPPAPYIDKPFLAVIQKDPTKALEPVPIGGKIVAKAIRNRQKNMDKLRRGEAGYAP